jgi:Kdo2-lipid IVA lauroyltransferase/acyltransferase
MAMMRRARRRRLMQKLEYGGIRTAEAIARLLGVDAASWLSGKLWRFFAPFNKRQLRADKNLAAALPALSASERKAILGDMWENLGRTFIESFVIEQILAGRIEIEPSMADACRRAIDGGGIAVSLHSGNWELMVPAANQLGCVVMGVYQRVQNPLVEHHVLELRQRYYRGGIVAKGPTTARQMLRMLQSGGIVGMLADMRDDRGMPVPFFGRAAPSTTFPAQLAVQRRAPIFVLRVLRMSGVRFSISAERIDPPVDGDRQSNVEAITARIQAIFEAWIREAPAQWMWAHQRYEKERPPKRRPRIR